MCGTPFAPTEDRDKTKPGEGFTHKLGDVVQIKSSKIGTLVNTVQHTSNIQPWSFGIHALFSNLYERGLLHK